MTTTHLATIVLAEAGPSVVLLHPARAALRRAVDVLHVLSAHDVEDAAALARELERLIVTHGGAAKAGARKRIPSRRRVNDQVQLPVGDRT